MNNAKQRVEIPSGMIEVAVIQEKIAKIEAERAKFVEQANVQVERLTGAILGLKELLNKPEENENDKVEDETNR